MYMAHQREIHPEVLEQITAALKEKARHILSSTDQIKVDGMQTLAAILKQGDYSFSEKLIGELEKDSPVIGKDLKEKLYTLDDVVYSTDRPIQERLALMSETEIAILLKGRKKEFCEKILSCVSAGRRQVIREEYDILGAVSKRDCDEAAGEFLTWFRKARKSGEIILYSDEDVYL
jgi:flagellar motor switch protein FliG